MSILSKASKDDFDSPVERLLASIANLVQQPTSKGAHFYRTSLRRFQAWSDVFHPETDSKQNQALRFLDKLRKATGKLRDSEVHRELLQKIATDQAAEKRKLEKALKARRDRCERKLRNRLREPILTGIWSMLRSLDESPQGKEARPTFHPIDGMTTLALNEYRAFVQRHGKISPENLHHYRLQCKRFRYTAELAGDSPEVNALVETWKSVQDIIGEWHDYLTLTDVAENILGDSTVVTALQELTRQKYADSISAIEAVENKLIGQTVSRKQPRRASAGGRSRAA